MSTSDLCASLCKKYSPWGKKPSIIIFTLIHHYCCKWKYIELVFPNRLTKQANYAQKLPDRNSEK